MPAGLRIMAPDPDTLVSFSFDGVAMEGVRGEMIAAALFANSVRIFRTMPKTGLARGGFCFAGRCSDCQVIVNGKPGVMACVTELEPEMRIETQRGAGEWGGDD